ncbi:MAG: Wzz/FepE/Etk N-terminal domain-containing protein, partial [Alphaproteobacteria bacterium]
MVREPIHLSEDGAIRREAAAGPYVRNSSGLGFIETWRALKRRRWTILLVTLLGALLAAFIVTQIPARYTATATVLLDTRKSNVVDFDEVLSGLPANDDTVNSEILVVRSPAMVARVARELNLAAQPEFNPALPRPQSPLKALNPFGSFGFQDIAAMFGRPPPPPRPEEALLSAQHSEVIDAIQANLT